MNLNVSGAIFITQESHFHILREIWIKFEEFSRRSKISNSSVSSVLNKKFTQVMHT